MSRFGKCQNLAGCLLAYRGEEIEVEKGQPFICPECGKPLTGAKPPSAMWMAYVYGILGVAVLGGVAFFAFPQLRGLIQPHTKHEKGDATPPPVVVDDQKKETDSGTTTSGNEKTSTTSTNNNSTTSTTSETNKGGPDNTSANSGESQKIIAPTKIDLDVSRGENKDVRNEVLTRIDLMPGITQGNKDKLYQSVDRARSMGKVLTVPFGSGRTELTSADIQSLKTELEKPEVANLRADPTAVFVILGYADPKGDPKKNIAISQSRADSVQRAMKEKCGVPNVMHSVASGGSKLLDSQKLEKNRIVEIWAVLP